MRRAVWVILAVFGSYAFAQLLPLSYPRLVASLAGISSAQANRVWLMELKGPKQLDDAIAEKKDSYEACTCGISQLQERRDDGVAELNRRKGRDNIAVPSNCSSSQDLRCMETFKVDVDHMSAERQVADQEKRVSEGLVQLEQARADRQAYDLVIRMRPESDVRNIGLMIVATAAGLLGAFIRYVLSLSADFEADHADPTTVWKRQLRRRSALAVGPLLGIPVFWLLDSKFLIPLLYTGAADLKALQEAQITLQGIAIMSALAGLLGAELLGRVIKQATSEG